MKRLKHILEKLLPHTIIILFREVWELMKDKIDLL